MSERIWIAVANGVVVNSFIGDEQFVDLVRPDYDDVVEVTDIDPQPGVDWTAHSGGYRPPCPHGGWVWKSKAWQPPVPMPTTAGSWAWDEATESWVDLTPTAE